MPHKAFSDYEVGFRIAGVNQSLHGARVGLGNASLAEAGASPRGGSVS